MGVGEQDPFLRQPVDVRRGDLRVWIGGAAIAVTHVIGKDDNDVGPGQWVGRTDRDGGKAGQQHRRDKHRARQGVPRG